MTFEELQKIVYDAGIVGAGGAGFPTHRKFSDKVKPVSYTHLTLPTKLEV